MAATQTVLKDGQTDSQEVDSAERIRQRAYELWQIRSRDGIEGTPEQDWLTAERELQPDSAVSAAEPDPTV